MQSWKKVHNANIVSLHDCFTTRAFGDSSLVFVTDYHPLAKTLADLHPVNIAYKTQRPASAAPPERILWTYLVQLASALNAIHNNGLAARLMSSGKIISTGKTRIRLNVCGIINVVNPTDSSATPALQEEDLRQLGQLILSLATSSQSTPNLVKSLDSAMRNYSEKLRSLVASLLGMGNAKDIIDNVDALQRSLASPAFTVLDEIQHNEDVLYGELNQELENGRLVRLLTKLGFINERPELIEHDHNHQNVSWSETGERYYLKLFRDYVFHQVNAEGKPVTDLGHVLACLNKLDAGIEEKITLVTRDEQNVIIVSYRDLKRGLEAAFQDLMRAGRRS